eukprot:TRINITY_DN12507_c0_g1_i1.p1 TRINITY_DN12507_c0_g1~~TRINITY_DN12507_c0_g1_i1.p1  ORF type:complete len:296 (-),score=36.42 TRINITY_DN12507_c0_g1_i1:206-1093(-)
MCRSPRMRAARAVAATGGALSLLLPTCSALVNQCSCLSTNNVAAFKHACRAAQYSMQSSPGPAADASRRAVLRNLISAIGFVSSSWSAVELGYAADEESKTFEDPEVGYRLSFPASWTASPRRSSFMPFSLGPKSRTGTVLVAGDYMAGLAVSVSISNVRELLEGAGFDNSGRLQTIANIGKPMGVADLLLRQRDGILEEKNPLSRVASAEADGARLDFVCDTIVTLAVTGAAPTALELAPLEPRIKTTLARSFLRRNGEMVTVWATESGREGVPVGNQLSTLQRIVDSFQLTMS